MTQQTINVGATANDKQGDSLRAAFQKVNANFTEMYPRSVPSTSKGAIGDIVGMTAYDDTYFYYCISNYTTGTADIWKRITHSADTW